MSNSNNNSNENETNENETNDNDDNYTGEDMYEEREEHDEIDIPLIKNPDEIPSHKSRHREPAREHTRDRESVRVRDLPVKKLHSKPSGKSSLKLQESNEKFTVSESAKDTVKDTVKDSAKDSAKEKSFFSKYKWIILVFLFILLCIGLYFLWTKKLKMMFHSGGNVSTNSSNQTLDLNLLDSMNKNI